MDHSFLLLARLPASKVGMTRDKMPNSISEACVTDELKCYSTVQAHCFLNKVFFSKLPLNIKPLLFVRVHSNFSKETPICA
jgi:hypothetical protein